MITFIWGVVSCRPHCTPSRCFTFITNPIDSFLCHCICVFSILPICTSLNNQLSFRTKVPCLCDVSFLYSKVLHWKELHCPPLPPPPPPRHLRFVLVTVAASFFLITSSVTRAWRLSHLCVIHVIWQKQQSLLGQGLCWNKEDKVSSAWNAANCQWVSIRRPCLIPLTELFDKYVSVTSASFTRFPLCTMHVLHQALFGLLSSLSTLCVSGCSAVRWRQPEEPAGEGEARSVPYASLYPSWLPEPAERNDWSGRGQKTHG